MTLRTPKSNARRVLELHDS